MKEQQRWSTRAKATAAALIGALLLAGEARAQITLISNDGQATLAWTYGTGTENNTKTGQRFHTGSNAAGYPWAATELNTGTKAWATAGYASGELRVRPAGQDEMTTELDMMMAGAGGRSQVLGEADAAGLSLALTGDGRFTRTWTSDAKGGGLKAAEADVWVARAGLEGQHRFELIEGAFTLTPSTELGLRLDGGDAERGFGAEIGAGLGLSAPARGLSAEMNARWLLMHEDAGFEEWGADASLQLDPRPETERGLTLTLTQSWGGSATGGVDRLLGAEIFGTTTASIRDRQEFEPPSRLAAEAGHGIRVSGGRLTAKPNVGFGASDGARDYRVGLQLRPATGRSGDFDVSIDWIRREAAVDDSAEHAIMIKAGVRW